MHITAKAMQQQAKSSHLDKEPQESLKISLQRSVTFKSVHQYINLIDADDWG